jgi:hypothetical protein
MKIFGCFFCIFTVLFFSNCKTTVYYVQFKEDDNISSASIVLSEHDGKQLHIVTNKIGNFEINNFQYDYGYIKIDDYKILFERNNIDIIISANTPSEIIGNTYYPYNYYVYNENNGIIKIFKMNEPIANKYDANEDINVYDIYFTKKISNNIYRKLINLYENKKNNVQLYLKYDITIDDEVITEEVIQEFELYITKSVYY